MRNKKSRKRKIREKKREKRKREGAEERGWSCGWAVVASNSGNDGGKAMVASRIKEKKGK